MFKRLNQRLTVLPLGLDEAIETSGTTSLLSKINMKIGYSGKCFERSFTAEQRYSWLGCTKGDQLDGETSLAGLATKYVTPSGNINTSQVMVELQSRVALSQEELINHETQSMLWEWYDNHVALLFNLIRLYVMAELKESGGLKTTGTFPKYDDGHVQIDPNFRLLKPDEEISWSWPGGKESENYPRWTSTQSNLPEHNVPHIDLRALLRAEAIVVLLATSKWRRQSNFRIDFDYPKLADQLVYRYTRNIQELDDWILGKSERDFPLSDKRVIWLALRKYVVANNLYNQFYSAASVLSQLLLTVIPDSAEGQVWLTEIVEVGLPRFGSVRGWYPFLTNGEAALIQETALEDWAYLKANPGLLYSTAISVATLLPYGIAARNNNPRNRRQNIVLERDRNLIKQPETFVAACLSLASGLNIPLNGSENAYVFYPGITSENKVWALPCKFKQDAGYLREGDKLVVTGLPYIGSPYVCYPLDLTVTEAPTSGLFKIPKPLKWNQRGALYTALDAWKFAWTARICGYDVNIQIPKSAASYYKYYASNENSWTHILTNGIPNDIDAVQIISLSKRKYHFITIPDYTSSNVQADVDVDVNVSVLCKYFFIKGRRTPRFSNIVIQKDDLIRQIHPVSNELNGMWSSVQRADCGLMIGLRAPVFIPEEFRV